MPSRLTIDNNILWYLSPASPTMIITLQNAEMKAKMSLYYLQQNSEHCTGRYFHCQENNVVIITKWLM